MEIRGLGYIGLRATDLAAWRPFAEELLGFMPAQPAHVGGDESVLYYRLDQRSWRVAIHPADEPGLDYVGWELPDRHALERAREELRSQGVELDAGADPAARGVSDLLRFVDPYGHAHELFYGAPTDLDRPFVSPAGVSGFFVENGIGHVLFVVPDAHEAEDYYTRVLAMQTTDRMDMGNGKRTIFLRARERHHSIAVTDVLPEPGFNHVMFETLELADVGQAWDRVQHADAPIVMTLGQHANDAAVSFYVTSPSGCGVELGHGGTLIDEESWVVREVGPNELWGHRGPTMDEIEAGGGRA
ncbi:MAG: VOC family protein [Deltaproteobacteria bacterium]|jgi:2,3-dihydroxybiphenyl 1,2-dioxygenase|nr:VOC family protein [Deltaproteobacteria bacterium]